MSARTPEIATLAHCSAPHDSAWGYSKNSASGSNPVVVLKFGSSILPEERFLPRAVHEIYRYVRQGYHVVAVVSALAGETDRLIRHARSYGDNADREATAALVSLGESHSAALLCLALDRAGVPANALDSAGVGLRTNGDAMDARPVTLDAPAVSRALAQRPVLVVPGFVGRDDLGRATLLGRGGSDLTALFIAGRIGARRCVLLKDVDGLYEADPSVAPDARRYQHVSYEDVLNLSEGIVQHKAVRYARDIGLTFGVGAIGRPVGTWISRSRSIFATNATCSRPLCVSLVGAGVVGRGVYERLRDLPEVFSLAQVCVRDVEKHASAGIERSLLTSSPGDVLNGPAEVVVDLTSGEALGAEFIAGALRQGKHVVTASKAVLAGALNELADCVRSTSARLLYSACVGGGVPVVEAVRRAAAAGRIVSIRGVLNGTCNFVLDEMSRGVEFADAVRAAQIAGFAEADPNADLDGRDAAAKASILAFEGFGCSLALNEVGRTGISHITPRDCTLACDNAGVLRLVAEVTRRGDQVLAFVSPQVLPAADPLASVRGEHNCCVITFEDGSSTLVHGRGAGRWPTTESVMADLFDLARNECGPRQSVLAEEVAA